MSEKNDDWQLPEKKPHIEPFPLADFSDKYYEEPDVYRAGPRYGWRVVWSGEPGWYIEGPTHQDPGEAIRLWNEAMLKLDPVKR